MLGVGVISIVSVGIMAGVSGIRSKDTNLFGYAFDYLLTAL